MLTEIFISDKNKVINILIIMIVNFEMIFFLTCL